MGKRTVSVAILFFVLVSVLLTCLPVTVAAVTFEPGNEPAGDRFGDFGYLIFPDGTVYISDYFGDTSGDVVIPATLNDHAVDGFWLESFYCRNDITSIVISEGIPKIDAMTFYGCSNLVSITIPASVTTIGDDAFKGCTALQTVIYNGTAQQLAQMLCGKGNEALADANADFAAILDTIPSEPIKIPEDEIHTDGDEAGNADSNDGRQENEKVPVDNGNGVIEPSDEKDGGIFSSLTTNQLAVIVLGGALVLCIVGILLLRAKCVK